MKARNAFILGSVSGYLLTSGMGIPFPSNSFWYFSFGVMIIGIIIVRTYNKVNDDLHPGEY